MLQMNAATLLQHGQPHMLKVCDSPVHWNTAGIEDDGGLEFLCCLVFCAYHARPSNSPKKEIQGTQVRGEWSPRNTRPEAEVMTGQVHS